MDFNAEEKEEFGFSRNYFLEKEMGSSGKKSARKLSDQNRHHFKKRKTAPYQI
ncbi:hypothetical protein Gotur_015775 [Gossypium turneri]